MVLIKLHKKSQLEWASLMPKQEKSYLLALLNHDATHFFSNIKTSFHILQTGNRAWPVTVNEFDYENAYTCSPYSHYVSYGKQELWKLRKPLLEKSLSALLTSVGGLLKATKINKIVCVNNWLLSTNLYPQWDGKEVGMIKDFLISEFPGHALLFRSLNLYTNAAIIDKLQKNGFRLIPAREIFIFDEKLKRYSKRRNTIKDCKLLDNASNAIVEHDKINNHDYQTIVDLYAKLYKGYSNCSPVITEKFVRLCHEHRFLNMQGIRNREEKLIGILGSYNRNGVLATPLVGYDTDLPIKNGLFRMVTALAMKSAQNTDAVFNISSGVSEFKRLRGAVKFIEYNAIFHNHLSGVRKLPWNSLQFLMTHIGIPLLNKFNF